MLRFYFPELKFIRSFEIGHVADWQFCLMAECFKDCGQEVYVKEGEFVVKNKWITFRAFDDRNTMYEVKLSMVEKGLVQFLGFRDEPLFSYGPLQEFEKENGKIEMADFLKDKNKLEKIRIYEKLTEYSDSCPYTETLFMEMDRNRDILRFYLTVAYRTQSGEDTSECMSPKNIKSRIKTMTLDEELTVEFKKKSFMEVIKKIEQYCERKKLPLSFRYTTYILPGHCIDIPYTIVTSENFEISFEFGEVSGVKVAKSIMDSTFYTDTLGDEYNVGTIVREIRKETQESAYVRDRGAENILKQVYEEESKYIFSCWYY